MPIEGVNAVPEGMPEGIIVAGRWGGLHGIGDSDCPDVLLHSVSGGCDRHDGGTAAGDAGGSGMGK